MANFPFSARGAQPVPAFLSRNRLSIDDIKKDPFKLTRQRSRLKQPKKEDRIDSASVVSIDCSKCRMLQSDLKHICSELGWKIWQTPRQHGGKSDIYWHAHQIEDFTGFPKGALVNKFPMMSETLRKINLTRALMNASMIFPDEFDFYPQTWFLPYQFHHFCADVAYKRKQMKKKERKKKSIFIVKPDAGTQGDGIYLLKEPQDYRVQQSQQHVVQEYISNPLLLDKMKFDLRVYAVLVSLNPLKIYLSKEGLGRLCTIPYKDPTSKNIHDSYMHLTNYSLNKYSERYIHTDRLTDGSKRTLTSVLTQLSKMGHDSSQVWASIEQVVIKTLLALTPELQIAYDLHLKGSDLKCVQILGFDILLTDELKPMLLEVNASPSLCMTFDMEVSPGVFEDVPSTVDRHVKYKLIKEVLLISAPSHKLQTARLKTTEESEKENGSLAEAYEALLNAEAHPKHYLYEAYPGTYSQMYKRLHIVERMATLYQMSLGIRESLMSANSFRMFARKCCLAHQNNSLTVAALDIMYIDIQRRWNDENTDTATGMTFQAFIEAFMLIARRSKLKHENTHEMVDNLLHYCEANLEYATQQTKRRGKLPKIPVRHTQRSQMSPPRVRKAEGKSGNE